MTRGVGKGTAVGSTESFKARDSSVELVADEDPVFHEVEALVLDSLVVKADSGKTVLDSAVTGDVHDIGAVAKGAQLVESCKRRTGIRRLIAHRPVSSVACPIDSWIVSHRFEGSMDEVVGAWDHSGGPQLLGKVLGDAGELLRVPVPALAKEVLPTSAGWRSH